tara:strand:+ start:1005 stop:1472 length:468 start_codon:yes stop_codon:yes gene_type:complete
VLQGCALFKNNDYALNFKELRRVSEIDSLLRPGPTFYPKVTEFSNSNACMKAFKALQSEDFLLLGYAIFQHKGKLSQGLAIKMGKELGAHKILLSRELANSSTLENIAREDGPGFKSGFKGSPFIEALLSVEERDKTNGKAFYLHSTLFLVKINS